MVLDKTAARAPFRPCGHRNISRGGCDGVSSHVWLPHVIQSNSAGNECIRGAEVFGTAGLGSSRERSSEGMWMEKVTWKRLGDVWASRKADAGLAVRTPLR